jgi:hypothetical protein
VELSLLTSEKATELKSAARAWHQHITVERATKLLRLEPIAPEFVTSAVIGDASGHKDCDLHRFRPRRQDDLCLARGAYGIAIEQSDNFQLLRSRMIDQIRGSDTERVGDPVQPSDGDCPHPRLKAADCLRRRCGRAGPGDIIERHALGFPHFPDARDHRRSSITR